MFREVYNGWITRRKSRDNGIFYYVLLQEKETRRRYLKLGITFRGISRFRDKDYDKYSFIKPLYMVECDDYNTIKDLEDLNRVILRNTKGYGYIENDRFTYFKLTETLPLCRTFGKYEEIIIKK